MSLVESLTIMVAMYRALGGEKYAKHIEEFYIPFAKHIQLEVDMIERATSNAENQTQQQHPSSMQFNFAVDRPPPTSTTERDTERVDMEKRQLKSNPRKRGCLASDVASSVAAKRQNLA